MKKSNTKKETKKKNKFIEKIKKNRKLSYLL